MKYIEEEGDKYFLIDRTSSAKGWIDKRTEITDDVTIGDLEKLKNDTSVDDNSTYVPCFNPHCNHIIKITKKQKRDLLLSFQKKYKKVVFVTCCSECQKVVLDIFESDS